MNKLKTVGEFAINEVLPFASDALDAYELEYTKNLKQYTGFNGKVYKVKMFSKRYKTFLKGLKCAYCELDGNIFLLQQDDQGPPDVAHFNLYHRSPSSNLILFTKDHISPQSNGGNNHINNLQTVCEFCNNAKANLTHDQFIGIKTVIPSIDIWNINQVITDMELVDKLKMHKKWIKVSIWRLMDLEERRLAMIK